MRPRFLREHSQYEQHSQMKLHDFTAHKLEERAMLKRPQVHHRSPAHFCGADRSGLHVVVKTEPSIIVKATISRPFSFFADFGTMGAAPEEMSALKSRKMDVARVKRVSVIPSPYSIGAGRRRTPLTVELLRLMGGCKAIQMVYASKK